MEDRPSGTRGAGVLPARPGSAHVPDPVWPGSGWQPNPPLRTGSESSARTRSSGARADDLDHLGRLFPPERNVGGPPALVSDRGSSY